MTYLAPLNKELETTEVGGKRQAYPNLFHMALRFPEDLS